MLSALKTQSLDLSQLIEGCIVGNSSYQKYLYDHYSPMMFGICLRYGQDYHQSEDILQDGFVKVFNHLNQFKNKGSFEGWMKRIFINTAIEAYRKSRRTLELFPNDRPSGEPVDSLALQNLATQDLLKCIQQLPVGYRTIFNLFAIEGYSHAEIAKLLRISEGTSKSQLSRARTTLRNIIKQQSQHERK